MIFKIFIVVLGLSAAIWGYWLEYAGPCKAGIISAFCWGGGLLLLGISVSLHRLWLVYLTALICGIGQGLGYITPVSTLIITAWSVAGVVGPALIAGLC